jgi:hypothetical protein
VVNVLKDVHHDFEGAHTCPDLMYLGKESNIFLIDFLFRKCKRYGFGSIS